MNGVGFTENEKSALNKIYHLATTRLLNPSLPRMLLFMLSVFSVERSIVGMILYTGVHVNDWRYFWPGAISLVCAGLLVGRFIWVNFTTRREDYYKKVEEKVNEILSNAGVDGEAMLRKIDQGVEDALKERNLIFKSWANFSKVTLIPLAAACFQDRFIALLALTGGATASLTAAGMLWFEGLDSMKYFMVRNFYKLKVVEGLVEGSVAQHL